MERKLLPGRLSKGQAPKMKARRDEAVNQAESFGDGVEARPQSSQHQRKRPVSEPASEERFPVRDGGVCALVSMPIYDRCAHRLWFKDSARSG